MNHINRLHALYRCIRYIGCVSFFFSAVSADPIESTSVQLVPVSFESNGVVSNYKRAIDSCMRVWADVRTARACYGQVSSEDYQLLVHAIIGQLACCAEYVALLDTYVASDDFDYFRRVITCVCDECNEMLCEAQQAKLLQKLFACVDQSLVRFGR